MKSKKERFDLNDWGYYKLVQCAISSLDISFSESILIQWVLLLKSGYDVKIGYNSNDIFLLVPFNEMVFEWFYEINDIPYYVLPISKSVRPPDSLIIHTNKYGGSNMTLVLDNLPQIGTEQISKTALNEIMISVQKNEELLDFLDEYPSCSDLSVFFNAPVSQGIAEGCRLFVQRQQVDTSIIAQISSLLIFVQKSFKYKTDKEQFGTEKYLFADQLFQYPYSDCEDRSVLFCRLIKQLTGRDCIGLIFPGHVAAAVDIPQFDNGNYLKVNGKNFVVCDPTYMDAPIGYLDEKFQSFMPQIIYVN